MIMRSWHALSLPIFLMSSALVADDLNVSTSMKRSVIVGEVFGYNLRTSDTAVSGNGIGIEAGYALLRKISLNAAYGQTISRKNITYSGFSRVGIGISLALTGQFIQTQQDVVMDNQKISEHREPTGGIRLHVTSLQYTLNASPYSIQMPGLGGGLSYDLSILTHQLIRIAAQFDRLTSDAKPINNLMIQLGYGIYL